MSDIYERHIRLPRRGTTFVREIQGPPHAPVLLLLHGLAATAMLNWGPSLGPLGRGFRVLAIDHRGHGRGIRSLRPFRLEDCADDAVALATELGIERVIPVGYSMGGAIAQLVWKRHPERVQGLVLCATAARFANAQAQRIASTLGPVLSIAARATPATVWQRAAERYLAGIDDPERRRRMEEEVRATRPAALVEAAAALARYDARPWLDDITAPSAVVLTTADGHVPPGRQQQMADAIPGAEVFPVAADHYACVARTDLFVPSLFAACRSVAMRTPVRVIA